MKRIVLLLALSVVGCSRPTQTSVVVPSDPQKIAVAEWDAITNLKTIASAQETYSNTKGAGSFGTLQQLADMQIIDPLLGVGDKKGYKFSVKVKSGDYEAVAVPRDYGVTGKRSFFINSKNELRGADKAGHEATSSDPEL